MTLETRGTSAPNQIAAEQARRFYDDLAEEYEELVVHWEGDRWTREVFQELVLERLDAGSLVFDLGAGPGIDAQRYISAGHRVISYDPSARMSELARRRLDEAGRSGAFTALEGAYGEFERAIPRLPTLDAVVSNFAVLNLIPQPAPLLQTLVRRLRPGGLLAVSILTPVFWPESLSPRTWRHIFAAWRGKGVLRYSGPVTSYRHLPTRLQAMVEGTMRLELRQSVGTLVRLRRPAHTDEVPTFGERLDLRWGSRFPWNRLGRYTMLAWRRVGEPA